MLQASEQKTQRFFPVLGNALGIGLESNVLESDYLQSGRDLPEGFSIYKPLNSYLGTLSLRHPATSNGFNLLNDLFLPLEKNTVQPLVLTFSKLPKGLPVQARKINLRRKNGYDTENLVGFKCGRFTMFAGHPETTAFDIQEKNERGQKYTGHLNLDCLSKTSVWNPLYVKYHLQTPLKNVEFGYLKIIVQNLEGAIIVSIVRVFMYKVPEFLKNARTFPL